MDDEPDFYVGVSFSDLLMGILHNALASGLTLDDLIAAAEHAESLEDLDHAIDLLGMGAIDTDALASIMKG